MMPGMEWVVICFRDHDAQDDRLNFYSPKPKWLKWEHDWLPQNQL